jgi:hypothetical protein
MLKQLRRELSAGLAVAAMHPLDSARAAELTDVVSGDTINVHTPVVRASDFDAFFSC